MLFIFDILNNFGNLKSSMAIMIYQEQTTDSTAEKLGGSILNAIVFVIMIVIVTCFLVCLYKYRCLKVNIYLFIFLYLEFPLENIFTNYFIFFLSIFFVFFVYFFLDDELKSISKIIYGWLITACAVLLGSFGARLF